MVRPLRKRSRQLWDIVHLVTGVAWLGVALCQFTVNVLASTTPGGLPSAVYDVTHAFDRAVLIPLALGAVVSGVIRSVTSRWGLLRYWWVSVKLVLTATLMIFDAVWLGEWNAQAGQLAGAGPGNAYASMQGQLLVGSVVNIVLLTFMVAISVLKPWGRIPQLVKRPSLLA